MAYSDDIRQKLVIVGSDPTPIEIENGHTEIRHDLSVTHEEEDSIIIHQMAMSPFSSFEVVSDDTDVFVLLCHFVNTNIIKGRVVMVATKKHDDIIDINATVLKHR
jgi:hypothetical protein